MKHSRKATDIAAIVPSTLLPRRPRTIDDLVRTVSKAIAHTQAQVYTTINSTMTWLYWGIGYQIKEFEQGGRREVYGRELLKTIADRLQKKHGRGYSWRNLYLMCQFYDSYPISKVVQMIAPRLSWSKICKIVTLHEPEEREFYLQMAIKEKWTYEKLGRQIATGVYQRTPLALRKKALAAKARLLRADVPDQIIKDPYVFEFLGLPERAYSENELEKALINRLQDFLTELGKGFCFEARQQRIDLQGRDYYVDLVFYHRFLKCSILVDLKIGEFVHHYAGQMNYYLNWWRDNEMAPGDEPPVGIILCASKEDAHVEYALGRLANRIFVSRYQTSLPSKNQLQNLLMQTQDKWENEHGKLPTKEVKRINRGSL